MRALVQRVSRASVDVGDETVGAIGPGLCVFVGVGHVDDASAARLLASRVWGLRVFDDEAGTPNLPVAHVGGKVLVVSQFTLYADTSRGRRPSYVDAARPEVAAPLVEEFAEALRSLGATVATGRFRASMRVSLVNDGPMTFLLEA